MDHDDQQPAPTERITTKGALAKCADAAIKQSYATERQSAATERQTATNVQLTRAIEVLTEKLVVSPQISVPQPRPLVLLALVAASALVASVVVLVWVGPTRRPVPAAEMVSR